MQFTVRCLSRMICAVLGLCLWLGNAQAQQNLCEPRFGGGILNFSWECLNDTSMLIITPNGFQWQYATDSNKDGTSPNGVGANSPYEIYGIALLETNDSILLVLRSNLPLTGIASGGALNGSIAYGDLFLNLSGKDFVTAAADKDLYAIKFVSNNDSGVTDLGLYKNVAPKAVGSLNQGFAALQNYETSAAGAGAVISYGDFPQNQTYYAKTLGFNVIKEGTYLGPIQFLTANDLILAGYNMNALGGLVTVAFRFSKNLIIDQCGVPGGDGTSCVDCTGVACGKTEVDQCMVCGGDGKSCLDCAGVPFGNKVVDQCGICGGDGKSCLDCAGVPFGKKVIDQCNVCGGDGTSCLDCKGVPFGTTVKDQCGICGGDGTSCLDCKGVPNGSTVIDQCGVCGGNGTSCLDCKGVPFGTSIVDQCGVCGGDNTSCTDCSGTPNGIKKIDQCGVCGGDGKSCLDCKGAVNGTAKLDRCGVCAGDGSSCLGCQNINVRETLLSLDGSAHSQRAEVLKATDILKPLARTDNSVKKFVDSARSEANSLYLTNWEVTWRIPSIITQCTNTAFCATSSNRSTVDSYSANSQRLYEIGANVVRFARRKLNSKTIGRRHLARLRKGLDDSSTFASQIPVLASSCS